jgi:hypothetical protein
MTGYRVRGTLVDLDAEARRFQRAHGAVRGDAAGRRAELVAEEVR